MIPFWTVMISIFIGYPICFALGYLVSREIWARLYKELADKHSVAKLSAETWRDEVENLAKQVRENEDEQGG